jgi:hypothetical protein
MRAISLTLIILASALAGGAAQSAQVECRDFWSDRAERHCEVREQTLPGGGALDVDAGRNGGVMVRGSSRTDVLVRARVMTGAPTEAEARQLAAAVRIITDAGRVRAEGPEGAERSWWAVTFEVDVPQGTPLTVTTRNGGITVSNFTGQARVAAVNGPVRLTDVNGDIRGRTTNGPVVVDLGGPRWEGAGLEVETRNGPVRMTLPDAYSAQLELETVNGPVRLNYPITTDTGRFGRRSSRIAATIGSGGSRIRATTVNGPVSVNRR